MHHFLAKNKRVHLIVRSWAFATVAHPPNDKTEEFGSTFTIQQ